MSLIDRIRKGDYVPDSGRTRLRGGTTRSLAEVVYGIAGEDEALLAVRDFLDQASRRDDDELADLIHERPVPTGNRKADALVAGIAEHLSATRGLPCPSWAREPERFLDVFWFVSDVPGFRAVSLAQSPMALKRRGVMWPARSLERV